MKLVCRIRELQQVLGAVGAVVPRRPWQPALAYVRLEAQGGALTVTGADVDRWMVGSLPADVDVPGQSLLPGQVLCSLISLLPDGDLEMEQQGVAVAMRAGEWTARINGEPELELPDLTQPSGDCNRWEMLGAYLHVLVQRTAYAASSDQTRPVLTGVHLTGTDAGVEAAATNGHMLVVTQAQIREGIPPAGVTVPADSLRQIARLAKAEDVVGLETDQAWLRATLPGYSLGVRLLGGPYPSYRRLFPESFALEARVPRAALRAALQRAQVLSNEDHRRVVLDFTASGLTVTAREAEYGEVRERIPCELDGQGSLQVCLNQRYLVSILGAMTGDTVLFRLNRPDSPVLLEEPGNPYQVLLMPILLPAPAAP